MKLNIGGQKGRQTLDRQNASGWTILDVRDGADIKHNIMEEPMPLSDGSVDAIYTSHTFEHIFPDCLDFVLGECLRVLKPSGKIRIVVPNIDLAIKAYVKKDHKYLRDGNNPTKPSFYPDHPLYYLMSWFITYSKDKDLNRRLVGGHVNVFNPRTLKDWLSRAGFANMDEKKFNDCSRDFRGCDFPRYKNCSVYMEAEKA